MTKLLSALLLSAFAFSAQAASHAGGAPMKDKAAAPTTRAEVKADAASAVKAGTIAKGEGPSAMTNAKPKVSQDRADVKKEAAAAEKAGTIEKGPSPNPGKDAVSVKSRAEVKVEAAAAVKAGEVGKGPDVKK